VLLLTELIMNDDLTQATLAAWATRGLPARLDVETAAKLLGFALSDMQILMATGKLEPLGDPAPNAPKWFAAVQVIRLATDQDWLHKATKEVAKHWRIKRERQKTSPPSPRLTASVSRLVSSS
jgi:hypothetical protein